MTTGQSMAFVVATGVMFATAAGAAPTDTQKCRAAKLKAAGKYHFCRVIADRKVVLLSGSPDYSACDDALTSKWAAAEMRFGAACPTSGDQTEIQATATGDSSGISSRLSPAPAAGFFHTLPATGQTTCWQNGVAASCIGTSQDGENRTGAALQYRDNGDGTVTDMNTGLMWEQKSYDGGLHDWTNCYRWSGVCTGNNVTECQRNSNCTVAGGTCKALDCQGGDDTIFEWVDGLNAGVFAGYTDWRVPNQRELQSIVDLGAVAPSVAAAFNSSCNPGCGLTTCSCTITAAYWSSSTFAVNQSYAWASLFDVGYSDVETKNTTKWVRAVRGGL